MDNEKFGIFIAQIRKERGLSQRQLAEQLGVTDKAVSKWERGLGFPDIKTIAPLADALGISIMELMQAERVCAQVTPEQANEAVENVIDKAIHQQEMARRNLVIEILALFLAVVLVLLIDEMQLFGFVMFALPIICGLVGIWLIAVSFVRRRRGLRCKAVLLTGVVLLMIPLGKLLLLLLAMMLGGPNPA